MLTLMAVLNEQVYFDLLNHLTFKNNTKWNIFPGYNLSFGPIRWL